MSPLFVTVHVFKTYWYGVSRIQLNYGRTDPPPRQMRDSEAVCPHVENLLVLGGPKRGPREFLLRVSQITARHVGSGSVVGIATELRAGRSGD